MIQQIFNDNLSLVILLALFDTLFHAYLHAKWNVKRLRWLFWEPRARWLVFYRPLEWSLNGWALWHIYAQGNQYQFWAMVLAILLMSKDIIYVIFSGEIKSYITDYEEHKGKPTWLNYGFGYFLFSAGYNFSINKFFISGLIGLIILAASRFLS